MVPIHHLNHIALQYNKIMKIYYDLKSTYKSVWIHALLIAWDSDTSSPWRIKGLSFFWYGLDYFS
jgi:hypothetical protein